MGVSLTTSSIIQLVIDTGKGKPSTSESIVGRGLTEIESNGATALVQISLLSSSGGIAKN